MKQWMHTRPIRTFGLLLTLSLMVTACDPQDLMQLLDAQPVAQEAPAAAAGDHEVAEADDAADAPEDEAAKAGDAEAEPDTGAEAEEPKAERRTKRRQRRESQDATADEARAPARAKESGGDGDGGGSGGDGSADLSGVEQAIYDRLNDTRRSAGLKALTLSAEISDGAESWSCQMARSGNFRHADLKSAGVSGENIAWGQEGAAAVHDSWMTSSGHRDNRMSSRWSAYGVGVCNDDNGRPYYTERFR